MTWVDGEWIEDIQPESNWRDPNNLDTISAEEFAKQREINEDQVTKVGFGVDWRAGLSDEQSILDLFKDEQSFMFNGKWQLSYQQALALDEERGKGRAYRGPGGPPRPRAVYTPPPPPVLIPGRDALNIGTTGVVDSLTSFIFEDLAGTEIITLLKRDTIDGIDPNYSIISNISEIRRDIDPTKLISKKIKHNSYFDIFAIKLLDKIPDTEYLTKNNLQNFYYIDTNGDLVIEFDNLADGEIIDVQIATSGTINKLDND